MTRSKLPVDDIIKKYKSGISLKKLSAEYNCSVTIDRKSNVKSNRKYDLNKEYFDVINSENKTYWLGVLSQFKSINLSFDRSDESHLRKFLNDIQSTHPIYYNNNKAYIKISNKYMSEKLSEKKNIVPNKFSKDYWRGIIDINGNINEEKSELNLIATKQICLKFKKFCNKHVKTKASVIKKDNLWSITLQGNIAFKIIDVLYKNSLVYLNKNHQIYIDWGQRYVYPPVYPIVARFFKKIMPEKIHINKCKIHNGLEGDCTYKNNKYYIRISNKLNDSEAINCLLHELGHVGTMLKQNDPHGSAFGIAYSKIYKIYESQFTDVNKYG